MRAFVALDLATPPTMAEILDEFPRHFHATMHFFGELPDDAVPRLLEAVRAAAAATPAFDVELRDIGAFPNRRDPRVIWVGFGNGSENVDRLAERLERGLAERGLPTETRPFHAHATLFRVRGPRDSRRAARALNEGAGRSFGVQPVRELAAYESRLGQGEAEHRLLAKAAFAGPG